MTPKEARSHLRHEISCLMQEQISVKALLRMRHTSDASTAMSECSYRAVAISAYLNALNELCGRKPSHNYKEGYRSHYNANEFIRKLRSEIDSAKSPATP